MSSSNSNLNLTDLDDSSMFVIGVQPIAVWQRHIYTPRALGPQVDPKTL